MLFFLFFVMFLFPSISFSHMSTYSQEMQAHHLLDGGDAWGQTILNIMPPGGQWNYVYNVTIDPLKWYVLLPGNVNFSVSANGRDFTDNPLDTTLLHDIRLNNQEQCGSYLRYLGYIKNESFPGWFEGSDGFYTLVYSSVYNRSPLGYLAYTTHIQDGLKMFDFSFLNYRWFYDSLVNSGYPEQQYVSTDDNPSLTLVRKSQVYDSYLERYIYRYDPYMVIQDNFSDFQFLSSVSADNTSGQGYGIAMPVVCDDAFGWSVEELTVYGLFPFCIDKNNWGFRLGYFLSGVQPVNLAHPQNLWFSFGSGKLPRV